MPRDAKKKTRAMKWDYSFNLNSRWNSWEVNSQRRCTKALSKHDRWLLLFPIESNNDCYRGRFSVFPLMQIASIEQVIDKLFWFFFSCSSWSNRDVNGNVQILTQIKFERPKANDKRFRSTHRPKKRVNFEASSIKYWIILWQLTTI